MNTFFISDLHLEENRPDITGIFLRFLESAPRQSQALYILGDFFESWVGDDNLSPFNKLIISALKSATQQGFPIFILHGNRDFLLGKRFFRESGCVLLPDEYVLTIANKRFLLMHGDTLCTQDQAYLKFRKKTRKWWVQKLFLMKSLKKRLAIASSMRKESQQYTSTAPSHIMDVTQAEVERVMQKHHAHYLIHGHTHREGIHQFDLNQSPATRIVLGPWHEMGSLLVIDHEGKSELKSLD